MSTAREHRVSTVQCLLCLTFNLPTHETSRELSVATEHGKGTRIRTIECSSAAR